MAEHYRTQRFLALGHDFECVTPDEALCRQIELVLGTLTAEGQAATRYAILDRTEQMQPRFLLEYQDEPVGTSDTQDGLVETLLWHINRTAVSSSPRFLLLHAGAVTRDGRAVLLPGATGSGKSTLTAGLVACGFGYLSDEVAAIDPASGLVHPFPKALTLKQGSTALFPHLGPSVSGGAGPCHVDPRSIRPGSVASAASVHLAVFPRFDASGPTELTRLSPADAVLAMGESTFNLETQGSLGLEVLCRIAEIAPCYRLAMSDLHEACRLVNMLLDDEASATTGPAPDEHTVLLSPTSDEIHVLNEAAALVWEHLQAGLSVAEVVDQLSARFGADRRLLRDDVVAVISQLAELRLVDRVTP